MTEPPAAVPSSAAVPAEGGRCVSWTEGIGDDAKSHVVHVDQTGLAWAVKLKSSEEFHKLTAGAEAKPTEAAALIERHPAGKRLPRERIVRVTYCKEINQLTVLDDAGKKQSFAAGGKDAQGRIFEAVGRHLGGTASEEDADAWSVMQTPVFTLAVIGVIGGFFIWMTTISDPTYEATGRKAGMKQLINWLGYTIGPFWMTAAVLALAAVPALIMLYQLVKRPKRQVLTFREA